MTIATNDLIMNALPRPVLTVGPGQQVTHANAAAESFFEMSLRMMQRQKLSDFFPFGSPVMALVEDVRQRGRVINFFIQVWAELRRVQWPDRAQVTQATAVVVVFCLVAGAYLGILDYVFNKLVKEFL